MSEVIKFIANLNLSKTFDAAYEGIIGFIVASLLTAIFIITKRILRKFKNRSILTYWNNFSHKPLSVILTEYPVSGDTKLEKSLQIVTSGMLISKGMAISLSNILDFLPNYITSRKFIFILGDKSDTSKTDNIIVLGSLYSNKYAERMNSILSSIYDLPYSIKLNETGDITGIDVGSEIFLSPEIKDGNGTDYALVVKAEYQTAPSKSIILISGCYMWGTQAASEAITNRHILKVVQRYSNNSSNVAFVIKTNIVNGNPLGAEIFIDNKYYIRSLNYNSK